KVIEQYVNKGDKLYIEGSLQTRKWADKDGNDRYSTEIVLQAFNGTLTMLSGKRDDDGGRSEGGKSGGDYAKSSGGEKRDSGARQPSFSRDMDDDIPFAPEWRG